MLKKAILEIWPSVAAFCCKFHFHQSQVGELINLKISPFNRRTGNYKKVCIRLSEALGISASELFPPELYGKEAIEESHFSSASGQKIEDARSPEPTPEDLAGRKELVEHTRRTLARLTPREEKVIRMRFGIGERSDRDLQEVGQNFIATRERLREVEAKALKKLRHPSRRRSLRQILKKKQ